MNIKKHYDICIIGGGINGAGIAADAALRGLSVLLCEQNDIASSTSSASSKLIHGGLRYLEHSEFSMVRKSLKEREILMSVAPHLIYERRFILPHEKHHRSRWLIRIGLFLYDHLAKRKTIRRSSSINLAKSRYKRILQPHIKNGFEYSDCQVNDARLTITNALQAKKHGADILTRTQCIKAMAQSDHWLITLKNENTDEIQTITAKALINATGPWAGKFIHQITNTKTDYHMQLVKGSHIVVPKLHDGDDAFILQTKDNRIIFVIPYHQNYSLIGTTEVAFEGNPKEAAISDEEITYLLEVVHQYFKVPLNKSQIIWSYSGVRPLVSESNNKLSAISRDYTIELQTVNQLPLLNIYSGKITTYRVLADTALQQLLPFFSNMKTCQTDKTPLPGGDIPKNYAEQLKTKYTWLPNELLQRYIRRYGSQVETLLADCQSIEDLGKPFGPGLYKKEVDYLVKNEWAQTATDILWRRTKLGLWFSKQEKEKLENYLISASLPS